MDNQQNLSPTLFSLKKSWDSAKNFSLSRIGGLFKNKQPILDREKFLAESHDFFNENRVGERFC